LETGREAICPSSPPVFLREGKGEKKGGDEKRKNSLVRPNDEGTPVHTPEEKERKGGKEIETRGRFKIIHRTPKGKTKNQLKKKKDQGCPPSLILGGVCSVPANGSPKTQPNSRKLLSCAGRGRTQRDSEKNPCHLSVHLAQEKRNSGGAFTRCIWEDQLSRGKGVNNTRAYVAREKALSQFRIK